MHDEALLQSSGAPYISRTGYAARCRVMQAYFLTHRDSFVKYADHGRATQRNNAAAVHSSGACPCRSPVRFGRAA